MLLKAQSKQVTANVVWHWQAQQLAVEHLWHVYSYIHGVQLHMNNVHNQSHAVNLTMCIIHALFHDHFHNDESHD